MVELTRRPWHEFSEPPIACRPRRVSGPIVLTDRSVVVCPDSDLGRAAAARLVDGVAAAGGPRLRVDVAGWAPGAVRAPAGASADHGEPSQPRARILLGSLSTNPQIAALYHEWLCPVDHAFPGRGGWYLRSYRDLRGDDVDVVVIGASSDEDLPAAVDQFVARADGGAVPHLHDVVTGPEFRDAHPLLDPQHSFYAGVESAASAAYRTRQHRAATPYLTHLADMFSLTGRPEFAQLYLSVFQDMMAMVAAWEPDAWGKWGFDADFQAARVVSSFHAIADTPLFTDEDRQRMTAHLVEYLGNSERAWHRTRDWGYPARHNHHTFASLGLLYGAATLGRAHRLPQTDRWIEMADECFAPQLSAGKATEDCDAYGWLTLAHTLRYALVRPKPEYITGGMCETILNRGITTMDNLGSQVPYGDAAQHRGSFSELDFLRPAAWALADPAYAALMAKKESARERATPAPTTATVATAATAVSSLVFRYDPVLTAGGAPESAANFGVRVLPLDEAYCETHAGEAAAPEDGFDKISFRDSFDPAEPYLLVNGIDNGRHGHRDAGAIIRFTSKDRIWLEDSEYDKVSANFHNTVTVARDGLVGERPAYAHLGVVNDEADIGVAQCVYRGYSGAEWTRTIVWLRPAGFVVVDEVRAVEAGEYSVMPLWRTVGDASIEGDTWIVRMGEAALRVHVVAPQVGERRRVQLAEDYIGYRSDWWRYPYAQPQESVLQDSVTVRLTPGEAVRYAHLLSDSDEPSALWLDRDRLRGRVGDCSFEIDPARPADSARLTTPAAAPPHAAAPKTAVRAAVPARPVWRAMVGAGAATVLDSGDTLAVAEPGGGVQLWRDGVRTAVVPTAAEVTALGAVGGGGFIAGQRDGRLEVFGPDFQRRWGQEFPPHMRHSAVVRTAFTAQLAAGAPPAVVIATESCHVHAYTADGEPMFAYEVVHAAVDAVAADIDGDGLDEILAITEYWNWHCIDAAGRRRFGARGVEGSGGQVVASLGGLALFGGWDGHLTAYRADGERAWDVPTGDVITAVAPVESDDGRRDLLAAVRCGRLYRIADNGAVRWRARLDVGAVAVVGSSVAIGLGADLAWLDDDGSVHGAVRGSAPIKNIRPLSSHGQPGLCVRDATGAASWFPVR